jgi:hypothetical protein
LVENRNGLIAAAMTTQSDGTAERDAALLMLYELTGIQSARITTEADKAYDTRDFVDTVRVGGDAARGPPAARRDRPTNQPASGVRDQFKQTLVGGETVRMAETDRATEEGNTRGLAKVGWLFVFSCAAFNQIRIPKLRAQTA